MLGGVAAGWLVAGRPTRPEAPTPRLVPEAAAAWWRGAAVFAGLGAAPDLDLLVGLHSTYTHSLAAVAVTLLVAFGVARRRGARWALACGAAVGSHILLDWLGSDTTPPIGIMALWPITREFYQSSLSLFPAVSRRVGQWSFVTGNALAVAWELLVLVPAVTVVGWARGTENGKRRTPNAERRTQELKTDD